MRALKAVLILSFTLAVAVGLHAEIIEQILVKVNGEILTKTDLEQRQLQALRDRGDIDPVLATEADLKRAIAEITPALLVAAVDEMLLVQRGREIVPTLTDEQFRTVVENIRKDNNLEKEEEFQAALKQQGMTMGDLRRVIERNSIIGRLQQLEINSKIDVTEEEARAFFEKNPDAFKTQPGITLREILIRVPEEKGGISVGKDEEAKAKAEELRARAEKGESFEKLAAEHSEAASKANGGLIGPISREEMAPAFQKLIDPLKPGQITAVVRSGQGWQFFKLESRTESDRLTFEQAKDRILDRIASEKGQAEMIKYIAMLREHATIEWKNPELKKAYEQGLAARADAPAPPAN